MSDWIGSTTMSLRQTWTLHLTHNIKIVLTLDGDEYFGQLNVQHMPMLGKTYKGTYLGTDEELPLEVAQATAVGKSYDEVAEILHTLERAMQDHGHEIEPLVPEGALDHKGMP